MKDSMDLERQIMDLNAPRNILDVLDIKFDFSSNSAKCILGDTEGHGKSILFEGIIDIHYAPDSADSPPWVSGGVKIEKISSESELDCDEGLWIHEKGYYEKLMPCCRVSFESGDFRLKVLCRNIQVADLSTGK